MENQILSKRRIRKVAVLGSGVMGSRIACHFANIGLEVLLLDIVPQSLTAEEEKKGLNLQSPVVRNRIVTQALSAAIGSSPSPIYHKSFASRIKTGNLEDDLGVLSSCDWIVEAVIEQLEVKKALFAKIETFRKAGSLITSNTSGIPLNWLAEGRSENFQQNFCGTHFFNPPRYLPLLEIIPTRHTLPEVTQFLEEFGRIRLGKTIVRCKDTPAFIANRIGVFAMLDVVRIQQNLGLSIEETDKLTGPVIGHPKSATFRTADVVGLDTLVKVADGLNSALGRAEVEIPDSIRKMLQNNWLGDKTSQGFFKKIINEKGQKEFWVLDHQSMEYQPPKKAKFSTLEATKTIDSLADRWKILTAGTDAAGEFYRQMLGGLFWYAAHCLHEIADNITQLDEALKAGFGWEMGPFETWDCVGFEKGLSLIKGAGKEVPTWLLKMEKAGVSRFYSNEGGIRKYLQAEDFSFAPLKGLEGFIILDHLRSNKPLYKNAGTTLHHIGEDVLCLEFHTKMNTIGSEVVQGLNLAFDLAEKSYAGLVIGNQGANFSAGANLGLVFMYAIEQEFDEIDFMIRQFQQTVMRVRYSSVPVVVAPHGLSLGGGCEMTLHADQVQAAAETYMGLVEVGVGLIPGGGGTKEMAIRISDRLEAGDPELNVLQNTFMDVATAKVSTSAYEGFDMHIMRPQDRISVNKAKQIADAREAVLRLAPTYAQPIARKDVKVMGRSGIATLEAGIYAMKVAGRISNHDQKVVQKLAYVINGGDLSYPQLVSEQYLLDLEREAFLSLCGERKTMERMQSLLTGGNVIRN